MPQLNGLDAEAVNLTLAELSRLCLRLRLTWRKRPQMTAV